MKFDVITFGSGTRDVYLISKNLKVMEEKKFFGGRGIAVSLGSKIEVDDILFRTGGGATNTAVAFRQQGFKTAWCGMAGKDIGGKEIIAQLKKLGVYTGFVRQTDKKPTNYSVILSSPQAPDKDRTILVYRGASSEFSAKDISWSRLRSKWFYLAPLSGKLAEVFTLLTAHARKNGIRVALNPGSTQLKTPLPKLCSALDKADILFLNQEEAALLARTRHISDAFLLKKLWTTCKGSIIVITKGPLGAVATDGKNMFTAPILPVSVVDRTGAGDAFCSGFLSEFMRKNNVVSALQFAMANSAGCVSQWGAKEGLLKKNAKWRRVPVAISRLTPLLT